MSIPVSSVRRKSQRGNSYVELAFTLVPFFAMIFGIVDIAMALFVRSTLYHAARSGARYAVTYQMEGGCSGHDCSIRKVVTRNSMGFVSDAQASSRVKIRYYDPVTLVETANNFPGNLVEVSIENMQWGWIYPLWRNSSPLSMRARVLGRMESLPGGSAPPAR